MSTEILINASAHEARGAVVENGVLQELFLERASRRGLISNIYKGRVSRVLPGMQAAFIEIGLERTAFLHASDIIDARHTDTGIEPPRTEGIRALVAEGNEILVQVVKDPLGTKGARLTTYITLPSRYLVYMPQGGGVGVSARIESESERERLRSIVQGFVEPNEAAGFIVRTAAEDATSEALRSDMIYLRKHWDVIRQRGLRTEPGRSGARRLAAASADPARLAAPRRRSRADRPANGAPRDAGVRRHFHAGGPAAHRVVRRNAAAVRAASRRRGDSESAGPQGAAEVRGPPDLRSNRSDDDDRRQHRRFRRPPQSRRDHFPDEPRGRGRNREADAIAQSRRHHDHRFHRHGGVGTPAPSHPGAGTRLDQRSRQNQHLVGIAAGAGRDDAQAHARKFGTCSVPGLSYVRGKRVREDSRNRLLRGVPRDRAPSPAVRVPTVDGSRASGRHRAAARRRIRGARRAGTRDRQTHPAADRKRFIRSTSTMSS